VTTWLKQSQVAHYLLSLGLVNPRAVIEEDLTVSDVSRRNAVFLVTSSRGPTHVIKQAAPGTAETLAHEANVLRGLADVPGLAGAVPELVHADATGGRLVLRTPPDAVAIGARRVSPLGARVLGRTLAALHASRPDVPPAPRAVVRSWGLSLPEPAHDQIRAMSTGALDVLAHLQASREVCDELLRLHDTAVADAFVHGDARWDNCLTFAAPGSRRRTRMLLIDWELAGRGGRPRRGAGRVPVAVGRLRPHGRPVRARPEPRREPVEHVEAVDRRPVGRLPCPPAGGRPERCREARSSCASLRRPTAATAAGSRDGRSSA
jgi:aminoglycoside phosphotransferase